VTRFTTCLLLLGALAASTPDVGARDQDPRPNIILILADDLGYGNLGSYGQQLIQTPELDTLADQGLRFTRFYASAPLCLPSRVSLMTGLHLGHSRVRENGGGGIHDPILEEDVVLPEVMKAAGYHTAMFGKWALGDKFLGNTVVTQNRDGSGALYKHGWDVYLGEPNQTYNHTYTPSHVYRYDPQGLLREATLPNRLTPFPISDDPDTLEVNEGYTTDLYLQEALSYIDAVKDKPFFLYLPLQTPHKEFVVPELESYTTSKNWTTKEKRFASMISRMDRMIGLVIDRLEQHGIEKQTLVIFTSDNGGLSDFDSRFDNNGPLPGFKKNLSEGGLRVPFIAWWPGTITPGTTAMLSWFPDLMPTFSSLAGIQSPSPVDGYSLLPTLLGRGVQAEHAYLLFLSGKNGIAPSEQDYYIVRGQGETRTDAELYQAAFRAQPVVSEFYRKRVPYASSEVYSPTDAVPEAEVEFESISEGFEVRVKLEDGVTHQVLATSNLRAGFHEARGLLKDEGLLQKDAGEQWLIYRTISAGLQKLFLKIDSQAFREPEKVPEN